MDRGEATEFDRAAFLAERREILLALDVGKARAFHKKYNPHSVSPSDEIILIGLHKARCEATDRPEPEKAIRRFWLRHRGYTPGIV